VARFDLGGVLFELVPGKVGTDGNARLCLRVADMNVARSELEEKGVQKVVAVIGAAVPTGLISLEFVVLRATGEH
jgi:hypothetical protein